MNIKLFPKAVNAAIIKAYKKGATLQVLAKKHTCSTAKIRKLLKDAKVKMRSRGPKPKKKAKANRKG